MPEFNWGWFGSMPELKWQRLVRACQRARVDISDLLVKCQNSQMQFHDVDQACAVTALILSGPHKVCHVVVVAGTLPGVKELAITIEEFAREQGCEAINMTGRPGFVKVVKDLAEGYRPIGTVYEKVLES